MTRKARGLLALALAALCLVLALRPGLNPATVKTEAFNAQVAAASVAAYVSLRAINAALSAVQEVEVGASFGASGSVQPLKWLEPVDDTVERVSELIFAITVVTGVLALSIEPVSAIGFLLLVAGLLGYCGCQARGTGLAGAPGPVRRGILGCGGLGLVFAVVLPCAFALGSWAGDLLTAAEWQAANDTLSGVANEARALIGDNAGTAERGWRETIGAYLNAGGVFWDQADVLLSASLTLGGVFILRTLVLPAAILLALIHLLRGMVRPGWPPPPPAGTPEA